MAGDTDDDRHQDNRGVGLFRDPPAWMKPGDVVEVEIDRLGTVVNTIADAGVA